MHVEIKSFPPERGRKKILVDGVFYGFIRVEWCGGHGNRYRFYQAGGQSVTRNGIGVVVEGDKLAKRKSLYCGGGYVEPLDERLMTTAVTLVMERILVSENEYNVRLTVAAEEARKRAEEIKQREYVTLRIEAFKRLKQFGGARDEWADDGDAQLIDVVVELMQWAQTQ